MEVHTSMEAAIAALEQKHFRRGQYNPEVGAIEWWNEHYDLAIILHNCQGFIIDVTFSEFFSKRKRTDFLRKRSEGGKTMTVAYDGDNDTPEPIPQEIAQQENVDQAFEELVEVVTENSGEAGRDSNWE